MTDEVVRCHDPQCTDGPPDNGEPRARWAAHQSLLCRRCADLLVQRIAEMPARRDLVRTTLAATGNAPSDGSRRTKGNPPVPLNLAAHDLLELMHATVVSWVQLVAEERTLRGPDRNDLRVLAPWLLHQLPWAVTQPWCGDLADEIRDLARAADRLTSSRARWNRLEAPCPACNAFEMGRWDGASEVVCASCDAVWPESDYTRLALVLAHSYSETAAEAAIRIQVPASTFRRWVANPTHRLKPIGKDAAGVNRYNPADVDKCKEQDDTAPESCAC